MHAAYQALTRRAGKKAGRRSITRRLRAGDRPKKDDANRLSLGVYQDFIYP
jgi:hypothetical protein